MKIDFDTNFIREHKISLLDCQIELVLRSLELYSYTFKFVCPKKKYEEKEDELRMSLIRDTYEQIEIEYGKSKNRQEIKEETYLKNIL